MTDQHTAGRAWLLAHDGVTEECAGLLRVPIGVGFDVIRVPYGWGRRALEELLRTDAVIGPVLLTTRRSAVEFLVTKDTAGHWGVAGTCRAGAGDVLRCPLPGMVRDSRMWLRCPDGSGLLTAPGVLELVLRATASG